MNTVSDLIATLEETRPGEDVLDFVSSFTEIERARLTHYPDEDLIRIASLVESGPLAVPLQLKGEMIDLMIRSLRGEDGYARHPNGLGIPVLPTNTIYTVA